MVELFLKYHADVHHFDLNFQNAIRYTTPGLPIYGMIRQAMDMQPKRTVGFGLIDGRLKTSQKLRRDS